MPHVGQDKKAEYSRQYYIKNKEWYTEYNQRPEVKERIRKHQQTPEYKEHKRLYALKKRKNMCNEK